MPNPVVHFEFISPDAEALQRFFADIFEWAIDTGNPFGYGMVDTGFKDYGIQGGIGAPGPFGSGHVTVYVEVGDIEEILARVAAAGGEVVMPKMMLPGGEPGQETVLAQFRTPTGHIIGLSERHARPAAAAAKPARRAATRKAAKPAAKAAARAKSPAKRAAAGTGKTRRAARPAAAKGRTRTPARGRSRRRGR